MKTLRICFTIAVVGIMAINVSAQQRMSEEQKQEMRERYNQYRTKLNLTKDQETQVEEINKKFFEGLSQIRESSDRRLGKYKMYKSLQADRDRDMKVVLTNEQYKTYQEFQKEMREEFRENRRGGNR